MYCYYESENFNLTMVPEKYKKEFVSNSNWLTFGFHYKNGEEPQYISGRKIVEDYRKTTSELSRITGNVDTTIRLSYFKGSYEVVTALKEEGGDRLLTADDDRQSYYFDEKTNSYIDRHDHYYDRTNGMCFVSTDLRLDNTRRILLYPKLIGISIDSKQNQIIAVFTHEWLLGENMFDKIEILCKFAQDSNYEFSLLQGRK